MTAGRRIRSTCSSTRTRRRGSGPVSAAARAPWRRSTVSRGGASSSCGGTTSPIWSDSLEAPSDFPDDDAERSLMVGQDGDPARAPAGVALTGESRAALRADRGERAGRAVRADAGAVPARSSRAASSGSTCRRASSGCAGNATRMASGRRCCFGQQQPLHRPGARVCRLCARPRRPRRRLGDAPALRRRGGRARQLACVRGDGATRIAPRRPDPHAVVPRRPGDRRHARRHARRGARGRGRRADVARRPAAEGRQPLPRHSRERLRVPDAARAHRGRTVARPGRGHSRCTPSVRWSTAGRRTGAAATRSGRATSARPSISPTASTAAGGSPSRRRNGC